VKRKYREAMRAHLRLQDSYIDGDMDDDAAEAQQWRDEHVPTYQAGEPDRQTDQQLPF
jgi:hypothetical protein